MVYTAAYTSPIGELTLACDNTGEKLLGLWIAGQKYHGQSVTGPLTPREDMPVFAEVKRWLDAYFAGKNPDPGALPLAPIGSPFRQRVWDILRQVPSGWVISYGEIARRLAEGLGRKSMSSQAVGGAVGHNPIAIIIPCHRVVGANGSLTGYAAGLDKKIKLLKLEGVDTDRFSIPKKGTAL